MAATEIIYEIEAPYPPTTPHILSIQMGASKINLHPTSGDMLAEGTFSHVEGGLMPRVRQRGGEIIIGLEQNVGRWGRLMNNIASLDLGLGTLHPYDLRMDCGAHKAEVDLGGLPLTGLVIKQGAGKTDLNFSAPNPQSMSRFEVEAGAGAFTMTNLANANFQSLNIQGGAGNFKLDFGGELRQDAEAVISTGMSNVEISIPASVPAVIKASATMGNVKFGKGFVVADDGYSTPAATHGGSPLLTIRSTIAMGSLKITLTK